MTHVLTPAPRKYSYNFACDVCNKIFNPDYTALSDKTNLTVKSISPYVTFFYIGDDLVAMYDETSGDLWGAWSYGKGEN